MGPSFFDSPVFLFLFWYFLFVEGCAVIAAIPWIWGLLWSKRIERIEARWTEVATGEFDAMTEGRRPFVKLRDGRTFPLVFAHIELDLESGERVRVLLGHCKRHRLERI